MVSVGAPLWLGARGGSQPPDRRRCLGATRRQRASLHAPCRECTPGRKSRISGVWCCASAKTSSVSLRNLAISFALLASSCPFVVEGRHEIAIREACVDKGGLFLTNNSEGHRKSPPDFLTVEEAADVLRIGRTSAYREARRYLATNGAEGLCACRFGKQIRIPRCYLEERLGGPITWPIFTDETPVASPVASITPATSAKRATRRASRPPDQDALPFTA